MRKSASVWSARFFIFLAKPQGDAEVAGWAGLQIRDLCETRNLLDKHVVWYGDVKDDELDVRPVGVEVGVKTHTHARTHTHTHTQSTHTHTDTLALPLPPPHT